MKIDFSKYKFRCSSLGKLMTNPPGKKDVDSWQGLSETTKTYLMECYVREKYGREKEIINKYLEKGLMVEEDAITLYSRVRKILFNKNQENLSNEYITGTPDIYLGHDIHNAEEVNDVKSSWDIYTFFATMTKPLNKDYFYQLQGYMELTKAPKSNLVYCLIDTPQPLILDEMKKLQWKMGVSDPDSNEVYKAACEYLEKAMTFSDIDIKERYIENEIIKDTTVMPSVYRRIEMGRQFLNNL